MEMVIGIISGVISGIGMGGGSVLILFLTNFWGINQHVAQATNLIFFIPTAIVAIFMNYRNKLIDFKIGNSMILTGIIGTVIGANISLKLNSDRLRLYFGIFLLSIAFYEIYGMIKVYKSNEITNNKYVKH